MPSAETVSGFALSPEILVLLFFAGLAAGFVDSIAGGGGLITLPVLFSAGMPPQLALGTNKLQGSFGTFWAACNFIHKKKVALKETVTGVFFTLIGAGTGAWAVQSLDPAFIRRLVPILLVMVLIYTFFSKTLGYEEQTPRMGHKSFFVLFGLGLGFYDGFFGPGTGSFWTVAMCILLGYNMTRSAGCTRIMNFTSNAVALAVFLFRGNVLWIPGLCMAAGQMIGAQIGSDMAIKKGAGFIRPVFMTVVALTIARLIYLNYAF